MKIVQSLWSKPARMEGKLQPADANKCGWADKKYNYFSWILSFGQFKKYYNEVELVTDTLGYDLLINKLELPYTNVKVVLDELNDYHPKLWAIGKIYAYSLQQTPFIHVDGDVYIWEKFNEQLENSSLLCQNKEEGAIYNRTYLEVLFPMAANFDFYPRLFDKAIDRNYGGVKAINAGIIGGKNIAFFQEYTKRAFELVDRNIRQIDKVNIGLFNTVFEQLLFRGLAEESGETLTYFNPEVNLLPGYFCEYTGVPVKTKLIHPCGMFKKDRDLAGWLEYQVQKDYPDQYYKIIRLLRMKEI